MMNALTPTSGVALSVALCVPAVRMVVVEAWAWLDEDTEGGWDSDHAVHPVLAIRATLFADGVSDDLLMLATDLGGVFTLAAVTAARNPANVFRVVECPWPQREDHYQLASHAHTAKAQAVRNARARP